MTRSSRDAIQRAAGLIEGVSVCVDDKIAEILITAVEMIDGAMEDVYGT